MGSTFTKHLIRQLEARGKPATKQRIDLHAEQMLTLVDQLDPLERQQIDADIASLECERKRAEHFDRYNEMNTRYQNALRSQWTKARSVVVRPG